MSENQTCKQCGLGRASPEMLEFLANKLRATSESPDLGNYGQTGQASAIGALAGTAAVAANVLEAEARGLCVFCHDKTKDQKEAA